MSPVTKGCDKCHFFFYNEFLDLQKAYERAFIFSCLDVNNQEALTTANECEMRMNDYINRAKKLIKEIKEGE